MLIPVFLPHYGCTERCIYCDQRSITDFRSRDLRSYISETLDRQQGPYEVGLFGGNIFGLTPGQLKDLFSHFDKYADTITGFRISTKPVNYDIEKLNTLKENKVKIIELGSPTFNDKLLSVLNRAHTAEDTVKAFEVLRDEGFLVALQFMTGLPYETMDDTEKTVEMMQKLRPHYIRIYPLVVLAGTPMGETYGKTSFSRVNFETVLDRSVYLYLSALREQIPVVRMGLSDNELIREHIIGGHYHPAYGYLVKSRAFHHAILANLGSFGVVKHIKVLLNNADVPHLVGDRRSNLSHFIERGVVVEWQIHDVPRNTFIIETVERRVEGHILDALNMYTKELLTSSQS